MQRCKIIKFKRFLFSFCYTAAARRWAYFAPRECEWTGIIGESGTQKLFSFIVKKTHKGSPYKVFQGISHPHFQQTTNYSFVSKQHLRIYDNLKIDVSVYAIQILVWYNDNEVTAVILFFIIAFLYS